MRSPTPYLWPQWPQRGRRGTLLARGRGPPSSADRLCPDDDFHGPRQGQPPRGGNLGP